MFFSLFLFHWFLLFNPRIFSYFIGCFSPVISSLPPLKASMICINWKAGLEWWALKAREGAGDGREDNRGEERGSLARIEISGDRPRFYSVAFPRSGLIHRPVQKLTKLSLISFSAALNCQTVAQDLNWARLLRANPNALGLSLIISILERQKKSTKSILVQN